MKRVPFAIIQSAKAFDPEAVMFILQHFEGYIASQCMRTYMDNYDKSHLIVDDDLYYKAEIALFAAIAKFEFQAPPEDFAI